MLCACSGEQFKLEDLPQSPESLATRDYSASVVSVKSKHSPESLAACDYSGGGLSSTNEERDAKFDKAQVDDVESTLKEALSLNYEVFIWHLSFSFSFFVYLHPNCSQIA